MDERVQEVEEPDQPRPMGMRAAGWMQLAWRPAGAVIAVGLALLIGWHVVHGKHGLSVWHQMREEDRTLQKQIQDLNEENAAMRKQIELLKSDPEAIEATARKELHYARQGEVIVSLPDSAEQQQTSPAK